MEADTIFALSTAPGRAGLAVIRVSGPKAGEALNLLTNKTNPNPRCARLDRYRDPETGAELDRGLSLWFPGPASFTGEDCAEIQCHGGRAVTNGLLAALGRLDGLRAAEPGEFTRRAVLNGRMDLTQAEGLVDLIDAETEGQRAQALMQTRGALKELYGDWRERLIRLLALAEAEIDFPDEGDVPGALVGRIRPQVAALSEEIGKHLDDGRRGERLREGVCVTLIGPPNSGKSTLLNALARRDVAITAEQPGTTRDVLEVAIDLGGVPVLFADTAGLRKSADAVESEGIRRARARAAEADLRIGVVDCRTGAGADVEQLLCPGDYLLANKSDLLADTVPPASTGPYRGHAISAKTGEGLDVFLDALAADLGERFGAREAPVVTRQRHRAGLESCREVLSRIDGIDVDDPELIAEDLRLASRALGRITGVVDVEDILDVVFREFCIGK